MTRLWCRQPDGGGYDAVDLPTEGLSILSKSGRLTVVSGARAGARARVMPLERRAVLLGGRAGRLLVNGEVVLGVRLLEARDEVLVEGQAFYFSATPAGAPRAWSGDAARRCGRCSRVVRTGDMVISCPSCGAPHHEGPPEGESEALLCWSHAEACGLCRASRHPFSPKELDDA